MPGKLKILNQKTSKINFNSILDHDFAVPGSDKDQKMTNDDFRKLMMTPRAGSGRSSGSLGSGLATPTIHTTPSKDEKVDDEKKDKGETQKLWIIFLSNIPNFIRCR